MRTREFNNNFSGISIDIGEENEKKFLIVQKRCSFGKLLALE